MTDALGDTAPWEPLQTGPGRFLTPRLIVAANLYRALWGRGAGGAWTHLGPVGAGTFVSVLIYAVL